MVIFCLYFGKCPQATLLDNMLWFNIHIKAIEPCVCTIIFKCETRTLRTKETIINLKMLYVMEIQCMVQNNQSLLNAKGEHKIGIRHFRFANSPYEIRLFIYGFKTSNRLKNLLLITLFRRNNRLRVNVSKENSCQKRNFYLS